MRGAILVFLAAIVLGLGAAGAQTPSPLPPATPHKHAPPATHPAVVAPQRAVLFEQNSDQGETHDGTAAWRMDSASPGPGLPAEPVIRVSVAIPERRMTATWSLRRNSDRELAASHLAEVTFKLPPGFSDRSVDKVPGFLMKESERARGVPIKGISEKVAANSFMIRLSPSGPDFVANVRLLTDMGWLDIPMVYGDGRRAVLAIQKGVTGSRVFNDAFAVWERDPLIKASIE